MVTLYANAKSIRQEATQLDPVKVALTLLLVVPFLVGWAVRICWVLVALLWTGAVHGWRIAEAQVAARSQPPGGG